MSCVKIIYIQSYYYIMQTLSVKILETQMVFFSPTINCISLKRTRTCLRVLRIVRKISDILLFFFLHLFTSSSLRNCILISKRAPDASPSPHQKKIWYFGQSRVGEPSRGSGGIQNGGRPEK